MRVATGFPMVLGALGVLLGAGPEAGAGQKVARSSLVRAGGGGEEGAATGRIRFREGKGGRENLALRVRGLRARDAYLVRDRDGDRTLGRMATNGAGTGGFRLRDRDPATRLAGMRLEVVDPATGGVVLEGEVPDSPSKEVREGWGVFEGPSLRAVMTLRSDPRSGSERMRLDVRGRHAGGVLVLFLENGDGILDDVARLDCEGGDDGEVRDGSGEGRGEDRDGFRLDIRVALDGERDGDGGREDGEGGGDGEDGHGEEEDGGDRDFIECSWEVDTREGDALPFRAARVSDLSGRRFEIRDGEGNTLVEGEVPHLEDGRGDDADDEPRGEDGGECEEDGEGDHGEGGGDARDGDGERDAR